MSISKELLKKYSYNSLFIETGTNNGRCVNIALELGFKEIVSIELDYKRYRKARERFATFPNIVLMCGNSALLLDGVLSYFIDQPSTIYLDAHKGTENTQVFAELEAVKLHYCKGSTIIIDDIHDLFPTMKSRANLINKLLEIDNTLKIYYIDGINAKRNFVKHNDVLIAETK